MLELAKYQLYPGVPVELGLSEHPPRYLSVLELAKLSVISWVAVAEHTTYISEWLVLLTCLFILTIPCTKTSNHSVFHCSSTRNWYSFHI